MFPQIFFGRGFFWNLFGRDFSAKFVWLRVSLQIVRWRTFLQIYLGRILHNFFPDLQLFFGRDVLSGTFGGFVHFFVVVSFENCFVQTSLQRVCGGRVSSNIFFDTGFY